MVGRVQIELGNTSCAQPEAATYCTAASLLLIGMSLCCPAAGAAVADGSVRAGGQEVALQGLQLVCSVDCAACVPQRPAVHWESLWAAPVQHLYGRMLQAGLPPAVSCTLPQNCRDCVSEE